MSNIAFILSPTYTLARKCVFTLWFTQWRICSYFLSVSILDIYCNMCLETVKAWPYDFISAQKMQLDVWTLIISLNDSCNLSFPKPSLVMQVPMSIFSCYYVIEPILELSSLDNSTKGHPIMCLSLNHSLVLFLLLFSTPWKPKHEFFAKGTDRCQAGTLPMEESSELLLWELWTVS